MPYDRYPGIDENFNLPVQVVRAIVATPEVEQAVRTNTTVKALSTDMSAVKSNLSSSDSKIVALENRRTLPYVRLASGTDLNTVRVAGKYIVASDADAVSMINAPSIRMGILDVENAVGVNTNIITQTYKELYESKSNPKLFYRSTTGLSPAPYPMSPWVDIASSSAAPVVDNPLLRHQMLQTQFKESRGGVIGTNGAAFAWRFDHGLNKFPDVVDLLRKYQQPASQAYFYHQFDPEGADYTFNNQRSWDDCIRWAMNDGIEPVNHSSTHKPPAGITGLIDEIAQSKADIQAAMPRSLISGWVTPGGMSVFGSNSSYATTDEGRLILANHAWAEGYTPGELHALNGEISLGRHSWTIDTASAAARAEEIIDRAIEQGAGVNFMVHPNNVGLTNMITLARLEEIMAYVSSKRDTGELTVLTLGGFQIADSRSSYRVNLLRDPLLRSGLTHWTTPGLHTPLSIDGEPAVGFTSSAGLLSQIVNLSNIAQVKGGIYELTYEAQATSGAVVRARAVENANANVMNATVDVELPTSNSWAPVRKHFTIPASGSTAIRVELGRVSGGAVNIRRMKLQAV